jgi:mono/diheme cytochrome c family protein
MKKFYLLSVVATLFLVSCGGSSSEEADESTEAPKSMVAEETPADPMENKGIGPVSSVTLGEEIDAEMAKQGQTVYEQMCTACHKPDKNFIGPAPKDILERRSPEWIMNMILNPEEMIQKDPIAKDLLIKFNGAPMANQNLTEDQARQVLEYFRTL